MGTDKKPAVGSLVLWRGSLYIIDRYPTHNLDSLEGVAMAVKLGGKRASRILVSESEVVR